MNSKEKKCLRIIINDDLFLGILTLIIRKKTDQVLSSITIFRCEYIVNSLRKKRLGIIIHNDLLAGRVTLKK